MEHKTCNIRFEKKQVSVTPVTCSPPVPNGLRHVRVGMPHAPYRRGFSIAELLTVLAIGAVIITIVVGVFSRAPGRQALDKQTSVILSLLEHARGLTLSAKNASVYGVHFETAKAVLFTGPTYSAGAASNIVEPVHSLLQISSISLSGGGSDVVFNRLVGDTAQSGTVTLSLVASSTQTKTVTIFSTGLASSN